MKTKILFIKISPSFGVFVVLYGFKFSDQRFGILHHTFYRTVNPNQRIKYFMARNSRVSFFHIFFFRKRAAQQIASFCLFAVAADFLSQKIFFQVFSFAVYPVA